MAAGLALLWTAPAAGQLTPAQQAAADQGRPPYARADVHFMQGMIHHHAQALEMARLAADRAGSGRIRVLAERIDVSQRDEIETMQRWLRERGEGVPAPGAHVHGDTLMPGMLTHTQLQELAAARGSAFDRLFLAFMIQHHNGAITMVEQLFASHGAGQDDTIFKFASDVQADQFSEVERMRAMLRDLPPSSSP